MDRRTLAIGIVVVSVVAALAFWLRPEADTPSDESSVATQTTTARPKSKATKGELAIRGIVMDPRQEPIAGARVWLLDEEVETTTDEDGRFALEGVDHGKYRLAASHDEFVLPGPASMHARDLTLAPRTPLEEVRVVLERPGTLRGKVLAGGSPVSARISLLYLNAEGLGGRTGAFSLDGVANTDDTGGFLVEDVAPGRLRILAEPEEMALAESRVLSLQSGETIDGIELELLPGGGLSGTVASSNGEMISGAEVLVQASELPRPRRTSTDASGEFELANLPAGSARIEFSAPGYRSETLENVRLSTEKTERVNVVLEKSEGLFGTVVEERSGEAISEAYILYPGRKGISRTDELGSFSWPDAPGDVESVQVISPFYTSSKPTAATPGREMKFELAAGGAVQGKVVDASGEPITEFTVVVETFEVEGPRAYSNRVFEPQLVNHSKGSFTYGPLRPGTYDFRARSSGLADGTSQRVKVRSGATTLGARIVLESGASIRGKVTDEAGEPVAGALVEEFAPMSPLRNQRTRTRDDGAYELSGLTPGRRSLRVQRDGFLTAVAAGLEVPAGGKVERDIVLSRKKPGEAFTFAGIGAALRQTEEGIRVDKIFEGQPAEIFGIQKGDTIVAVDGENVGQIRFDKVIEMIRGEAGVAVDLEIDREGEGRVRVEVERGKIVVKEEKSN